MQTFAILFSVALIVVAFWAAVRREKRRREAWKQLGTSLGLTYVDESGALLLRCAGLPLFRSGDERKAANVLGGRSGSTRIWLGDYQYSVGSGKNRSAWYFTVCVLDRHTMKLPSNRLRPERRMLDTIGQLLGGQDVDFAEDEEFSKAYVLQGVDAPEVRELYDERTRRWFAERKQLGLRVETFGSTMALAVPQLEPERAGALFDRALELVMLWAERYETKGDGLSPGATASRCGGGSQNEVPT